VLRPRFFLAVAVLADGFEALGGAALGGGGRRAPRPPPFSRNEFYPRGFKDADDGSDVLIISAGPSPASILLTVGTDTPDRLANSW
jgi:hypothetical protein